MSVQKYKLKSGETRYRVQIYFRGSDGKEHIKQKRGFTTLALAKDYEAYLKTWNDEHPDEQLERLVIHDFRHCHVTFLINNGIDSMVIAERTGHTKEMVERVYGHLFPSRKKEVLNVLNVEL